MTAYESALNALILTAPILFGTQSARAETRHPSAQTEDETTAEVEFRVWHKRYAGTIGDKSIEIYGLRREANAVSGGYCYAPCRPDGGGLRLYGKISGDLLELVESEYDSNRSTGSWRIELDGNKARGKWSSADGKKTLPINLHELDSQLAFPYEIRLVADSLPLEASDRCDEAPYVSAIRLYRNNKLMQQLDTSSQGTCSVFIPQVDDMNFDGWPDISIALDLPAGPNIPHQSWLYEPESKRFVDAAQSLQDITSPSFDPERKLVFTHWRAGAGSHGVTIFRWEANDLREIDSAESYFMPVLEGGRLLYCYVIPGYANGRIEYSPAVIADRSGGLSADLTGSDCSGEPPAWGPTLRVDVWRQGPDGKLSLVKSHPLFWAKTIVDGSDRWCPDVAYYDVHARRIGRRVLDGTTCTDTRP